MRIKKCLTKTSVMLRLASLSLVLVMSGCTVKLISDYDSSTDKAVTALQKKTETHLIALENAEGPPECRIEKHRKFYDEAKVDVSAIAVRAAAIPQNERTIEMAQLLADSLEKLEELHEISCLNEDQIKTLRSSFNSSFIAILKLELAKRRGDKAAAE